MRSSLPWDDLNSDPLADIREELRKGRQAYHKGRHTMRKVTAVFSGGLDSTTMVYHLLEERYDVDLVSFDYGQRHKKELTYATAMAKQLGLRHDIVDLSGITHLINNSALTSATTVPATGNTFDVIEVPEGHYAEDTMKATVVPNRNMIMLSIAAGIAVNRKANFVATGVHAGDHFVYPDCRPAFIESAARTVYFANEGFGDFVSSVNAVHAPFLYWSKTDIAFRALQLGVPLHMTWSCYKGGENHCGRCGTCVERLESIDQAIKQINQLDREKYRRFAIPRRAGDKWDQTVYDDSEYWRTQTAEKQ